MLNHVISNSKQAGNSQLEFKLTDDTTLASNLEGSCAGL